MSELFREEVQSAHQLDWLGHVAVAVPPGQTIFSLLAVAVSILGLAAASFVTYPRYDRLQGTLRYTFPPIVVNSPIDGVVGRLVVPPNYRVRRGDEILVIDTGAFAGTPGTPFQLHAEADGVLLSYSVRSGDVLIKGQALARVRTPSSSLTAVVPLPARDLAIVSRGMRVPLTIDGGAEAEHGPLVGSLNTLDVTSANGPEASLFPYVLTVAVPAASASARGGLDLSDGMSVTVDLPLGAHSLLGWAFAGRKK